MRRCKNDGRTFNGTPGMTTANKITVTRILLIPVFVMMAIYYGRGLQKGHPRDWQRIVAIFLFLVAAASDGLDGYVARRYNQRSRLGVVLDPIADKGLLLAAIITLSFSNWTYEFPALVPGAGHYAGRGDRDRHRAAPLPGGRGAGEAELDGQNRDRAANGGDLDGPAVNGISSTHTVQIAGQSVEFNFLDIPVSLAGFLRSSRASAT